MSRRLLGPFLTPWAIRRFAADVLTSGHLGVYLDEIVRQQTPDGAEVLRIERPRDVVCRETPRRRPEEQLPAIVLACPGTTAVTYRAASGEHQASFRLEVHAIFQHTDEQVGGEVASILALGAAGFLLQALPAASGNLLSVRWAGVTAADENVGGETDRSRHAEAHVLEITAVILSDLGGPLPFDLDDPPLDQEPVDPGETPLVEEVAVTTTPVEEID